MHRDSREFKRLQAKWYKKLKKEGFEELEQWDGRLRTWSSWYFILRYNKTRFEDIKEYYEEAGRFLHENKFKSKFERRLWELHCEGKTLYQIRMTLISERFRPRSVPRLCVILNRIAKKMTDKLCQSKDAT